MNNIIKKIRRILYNIKNIFDWSKVLWDNFDWDYCYLMEILEYKLTKMKKYFENGDFAAQEEYDKIVKQISECLEACQQLNNNEYADKIMENHYEKYPLPKTFDEWFDEQGNRHIGLKSMEDEERKSFLKNNELVDKKNKELRHKLFDTMRDSYEQWWD